jgi:hypothetical protein
VNSPVSDERWTLSLNHYREGSLILLHENEKYKYHNLESTGNFGIRKLEQKEVRGVKILTRLGGQFERLYGGILQL